MARTAVTEVGAPASHTSEATRLEAFSDGVFAIVITLLVIELRVPSVDETRAAGGLLDALAHHWPSFVAYAISFLVIGIEWINHHAMFQYIRRVDRTLLLLHIPFFLVVAVIPYTTAVLAEHLRGPWARSAALLYGAVFTANAVTFNLIWWHGVRDPYLLGPDVHREGLRTISSRYRFGALFYLAATALVFVSVALSLTVHAALALLFALPERRRVVAKAGGAA